VAGLCPDQLRKPATLSQRLPSWMDLMGTAPWKGKYNGKAGMEGENESG